MTRKNSQSKLTNIYTRLLSHYGPQQWWPADTPFEVIVGAILTQSTSWKNVEKSIVNLKKKKLLEPKKMARLKTPVLAELVRSSGYFNQKAKKLKCFLNYFLTNYDGRIAKMKKKTLRELREELLTVHGIGPETADSILLYALDKPIFVVDAYTKRIFFRLGFLEGDENYEDIQKLFIQFTKKDTYGEYHALIVKHGKDFCKKSKPRCDQCVVKKLCSFRQRAYASSS